MDNILKEKTELSQAPSKVPTTPRELREKSPLSSLSSHSRRNSLFDIRVRSSGIDAALNTQDEPINEISPTLEKGYANELEDSVQDEFHSIEQCGIDEYGIHEANDQNKHTRVCESQEHFNVDDINNITIESTKQDRTPRPKKETRRYDPRDPFPQSELPYGVRAEKKRAVYH